MKFFSTHLFYFIMHYLSINYGKTTDCKLLTLQDASVYDGVSPLQNIILEVRPPGADCYFPFSLINGWCSKTFTCLDFNLCCINDNISILPDGIYGIKYSVDPNLSTIIEFNHMRVCKLMSNYIITLGTYLSRKCDLSNLEKKELEKELSAIKETIDACVYSAEECLDTTSALDLYNEASERINNINNGIRLCCK